MTNDQFEKTIPTIILIERQTFVSESVASAFRVEFKRHLILQLSEGLSQIEHLAANLKLVVITRSMLPSDPQESKHFESLKSFFGTAPIALLGGTLEKGTLDALKKFNLKGVFPDATPTKTLIAGLKFILEGGEYFPDQFNILDEIDVPPEMPARLTPSDHFNSGGAGEHLNPFTLREQAVLHFLAQGQSNKAIANQLEIAENTIKIHIRNILKKLNVSNRTEAVLTAQKMNLIELH
jgi:DNA-binding NarL/FixJ family response regulator